MDGMWHFSWAFGCEKQSLRAEIAQILQSVIRSQHVTLDLSQIPTMAFTVCTSHELK